MRKGVIRYEASSTGPAAALPGSRAKKVRRWPSTDSYCVIAIRRPGRRHAPGHVALLLLLRPRRKRSSALGPRRSRAHQLGPINPRQHRITAAMKTPSATSRSAADETGQTMAEYGVLVAGIALVVVLALPIFGAAIGNLFRAVVAFPGCNRGPQPLTSFREWSERRRNWRSSSRFSPRSCSRSHGSGPVQGLHARSPTRLARRTQGGGQPVQPQPRHCRCPAGSRRRIEPHTEQLFVEHDRPTTGPCRAATSVVPPLSVRPRHPRLVSSPAIFTSTTKERSE